MTEQILQEKKASSRILTALGIAGVKLVSSAVATPIVGNNTYMSGGAKLAVGLLASGVGKGKFSEVVGAGFLVDGAEDIVSRLFNVSVSSVKSNTASASSQSVGSIFI